MIIKVDNSDIVYKDISMSSCILRINTVYVFTGFLDLSWAVDKNQWGIKSAVLVLIFEEYSRSAIVFQIYLLSIVQPVIKLPIL